MGQRDEERIRNSVPVAYFLGLFHPGSDPTSFFSFDYFFLSILVAFGWMDSSVKAGLA